MTELLICIVPYCMVMLGVILIGHLALGKQEGYKAMAWAAPTPEEQTLDEVNSKFYYGTGGKHEFSDQIFLTENDMPIVVDDKTEEPVLPYDMNDIYTAVITASVKTTARVTLENGVPQVNVNVRTTEAGKEMDAAGILDMSDANISTTVDPDEVSEVSAEVGTTARTNEICTEVADLLGDWLLVSRAEAKYHYGFNKEAGGLYTGTGFDLEDPQGAEPEDRAKFRETFDISAPDDDKDKFAFYSTSINEDADLGALYDETVDIGKFGDLYSDEGGVLIDSLNSPVMDNNTKDKEYWDRTKLSE
ncbi:MAG: hypothetical protein JXR97_07940 [Planctomycetes bacterium]|nr:hypothetical protein [Planctomycetota bacterium]